MTYKRDIQKYSVMVLLLIFKYYPSLFKIKKFFERVSRCYIIIFLINVSYHRKQQKDKLEEITFAHSSFLSRSSLKVCSTSEMKVKQSIFFFLSYLTRINHIFTWKTYKFYLRQFFIVPVKECTLNIVLRRNFISNCNFCK